MAVEFWMPDVRDAETGGAGKEDKGGRREEEERRERREEEEMKSRCGDKKSRRRRKTVEAGDTNTFRIGIWRIAGEEPIRGRYGFYGIFYGILYRVSRGTIGFFSLFCGALLFCYTFFYR